MLFLSSHPRAPCIHRFFQQACVTVTCQRIHSRRPAVLLPLTITSGNLDILAISGTLNCLFSDDNMNVDEKAKLVTNENFQMISDERNSSRINLNKQPDRTLSSFLFESQFYENLQIVSSAPVLSPVQENNLITDLRSYQARRRSTLKSTTENSSVSHFVNSNLRASGCSSMLEPNSLRSHEFESDDWINGNWQTARKSDTLLKLDDLSIRESDSSNPEENITLFLDMHQEDMEMERRRWARWRRCHFFTLSLCAVSAILSLICIAAFVLTILQNQ